MWQGTCPLGPENVPDDDDNENDDDDENDDGDDYDENNNEIMKIMMTILTSSKSARPECESSREKARSSPLMGSEHTQYTPDHHHDYHDCDEDVHVGNDDDDDGEANDHHVDGRFAISLFENIHVGKMRNTY